MNTSTLYRRAAALQSWVVPIVLAVLCIALSLGGDTWRELARYERGALEGGEMWRLATGHLVHLGFEHTLLNVVALGILVFLFEDVLDGMGWLLVTVASALAIDAGLYWLSPEVRWYVGLSGVLHGCMAAGAGRLAFARARIGAALLVALIAKLAWEQLAGPVPLSDIYAGGPVVVDAHLYGAAGGVVALAVRALVRRRAAAPV